MPPLPEGISPELVDFLKHCFVKDPRERPAALVLFEHPWVKALNPDVVSLVARLLETKLTTIVPPTTRQCSVLT